MAGGAAGMDVPFSLNWLSSVCHMCECVHYCRKKETRQGHAAACNRRARRAISRELEDAEEGGGRPKTPRYACVVAGCGKDFKYRRGLDRHVAQKHA